VRAHNIEARATTLDITSSSNRVIPRMWRRVAGRKHNLNVLFIDVILMFLIVSLARILTYIFGPSYLELLNRILAFDPCRSW
jgi:hypothetical protein